MASSNRIYTKNLFLLMQSFLSVTAYCSEPPDGLLWVYSRGNTDWALSGFYSSPEQAVQQACIAHENALNYRYTDYHYEFECSTFEAPYLSGSIWQMHYRIDAEIYRLNGELHVSTNYTHHTVSSIEGCSLNQIYDAQQFKCIDSPPKCGSPFVLSSNKTSCEVYCATGQPWDSTNERCIPPPEAQNCRTHGKEPIDFIQGRKYRTELVIQTGIRYPFSLTYFFNNQRNQERTPTGPRFSVVTGDRYLAATKPPMTASEYQTVYSNIGVPTFSGFYRPTQHYGGMDQYWRHSFDEILQIHGSQYVYQLAKGYEVPFTGLGASAAYPHLQLQALTSGEESFAGYKLTDNKIREVKKFNDDGRLMKIERGPQDVLTLTYDVQNRLDKITNSEGAYIQLAYQDLTTDSIYSVTATNRSYPVSATNNRGESVQITWGKNYRKRSTNHTLVMIGDLTKDTFKFSGEGMGGETDKQTEILA